MDIVGVSGPTLELRQSINRLAARDATVLIRGETGTGKELVARGIHARSCRAGQPFIVVDCAALRDTLLESQLFGHVRGAFTGAHSNTLGALRSADGGTLFLDELGELDLIAQAKLLRCLQERSVIPLGAARSISINIRVLAATHRDLEQMIREGRFREDLYFRINVLTVQLTPLRERRDDIPPLLEHFAGMISRRYGELAVRFDTAAMAALMHYSWPGNVRELANVVEYAAATTSGGRAGLEHLPAYFRHAQVCTSTSAIIRLIPLDQAMRELVALALHDTCGHAGHAAALLHVERRRFYRLARRYGCTTTRLSSTSTSNPG
jgi:DNA-binding NtrC family response regulator